MKKALVLLLTLLFLAAMGWGQIPQKISYQGLLTQTSGAPVADGSYNLKFEIFNSGTGGTLRFSDTQTGVSVRRGTFSVILDSMTNIFAESLFVEVTILSGPGISSPVTFSPRSALTAAPYAFRAAIADSAIRGGSGGGGVRGIDSVDGVTNAGGNVDFIQANAITITPNDAGNTVTFGETHSARVDNPHATAAAQTGALLSVDGVSNAGGDVDFLAGTGISIASSNPLNTVLFSATMKYGRVFVVAPLGGDYASIKTALDSCVSPSAVNAYLIRVMPGTYNESFIMKKFVTLQGAGKYTSFVVGTITGADSCIIEGLHITGNIICNATSPFIIHNIITGSLGNAIDLNGGARPWIKQNEISGASGWGIVCNGWDTDPWIIANKIGTCMAGGIQCINSSPTISNNQILNNENFGIRMMGAMGQPTEPTVDDNVIGHTMGLSGTGIFMEGYAEPRIIANDIYVNMIGIEIRPGTQPSILSNNINYNSSVGILCNSMGASKRVTIQGNHVHSNTMMGIQVQNANPIVSHNNATNNGVDVQYLGPPFPTLNLNVYDTINRIPGPAVGQYNATTMGLMIGP